MESQIEEAIQIAFNPRSDRELKAQALSFINQLRYEQQAWSVCLPLALKPADEVVRHFALDVVNFAVQSGKLESRDLLHVRDTLLEYVRSKYGPQGEQNPVTIENKIVQLFTYLFSSLYRSEWQTFFKDLLALTRSGPEMDNAAGTRFYIKVLGSVHDEIADTLVSRDRDEQQRDNDLKDLIRERDVQLISSSWREALGKFRSQDRVVVEQCLEVIGKWASWNDLGLIIDSAFLSLLFDLVSMGLSSTDTSAQKLRDVSLNTLIDILSKKMKGPEKLNLIEALKVDEVVAQLASSSLLAEQRFTSTYDTDLAELVAKLVNNTVNDVVIVLEGHNPDETLERANTQLKALLPYVLRFFSDEYDEICSNVIPCLTDILTMFRKKNPKDSVYATMLPQILQAIIQKMKYDETFEWGTDDSQSDEAEFAELRKRLQNLQQAVAAVDESLYVNTVSEVVARTFGNYSSGQLDWREVDLALHEMFLFGQLATKNGGLYSKSKPVSVSAEHLIAMMAKLMESNIASCQHPAIHLQFMEICVRYSGFFEANTQYIPQALENFVRFVHHEHPRVRFRSWYLFHRFVKQLRQCVGNIAQTVIQTVGDLLTIRAELPENGVDDDDMSSTENDQSADSRFASQLYLYEAIGNVCSTTAVPVGSQVFYIRSITEPLFNDLSAHLGAAKSGDERSILQIHHITMALGTLAHGFVEWVPTKGAKNNDPAKEVSAEFERASEAILIALESLSASLQIRDAARNAFSRLVGVLGNQILRQLPRWIDGLLSKTSSKDEMATFLRLLDQIVYEFKAEIFSILNALLTPFLQKVFAGIAEPTTGTDDEIQLSELKSQYLSFVQIILSNELGNVFVSDQNQPIFENVIATLELFAKDSNDLPTAKLAFGVLTKMISTWGGPDVGSGSPQPGLPGFDRFMMERFSPLSWALPGSSGFNPKDAQAKQVLGEAATMKKTIYTKTGQEYINWLRNSELRQTGMGDDAIEQFIKSLHELDQKQFRAYFQKIL